MESEGPLRALGIPASWHFYVVSLSAMLTYVLPLAFVATLPARALTRGIEPIVLGFAILIGPIAIGLVTVMWQAGLRRYTSATS